MLRLALLDGQGYYSANIEILFSRNCRASCSCSRWRGCVALPMSLSTRIFEESRPSRSRARAACSGEGPSGLGFALPSSASACCSSTDLLSQPRATLPAWHKPQGLVGQSGGPKNFQGLRVLNKCNHPHALQLIGPCLQDDLFPEVRPCFAEPHVFQCSDHGHMT
jgi:hypothetical protein